jgi:hypothetical protein
VLKDVQGPSAPAGLKGSFQAGKLSLAWSASGDNSALIAGSGLAASVAVSAGAYTVAAFDPTGNRSNPALLTVIATPKPKGLPKHIPAWAYALLAGKHPTSPNPLPAWFAEWKAWRLAPFTIAP